MRAELYLSICFSFLLTVSVSARAAEPPKGEVDFAREVLPILSDKCFVCHGPDTKEEDGLRLDSFEGATSDRGGYRAIDPNHLDESELLTRIHSDDDPMPPEDAEKQLSDAERVVLTKWVKQGGKYAKHWSFVTPKRATHCIALTISSSERFAKAEQISPNQPTVQRWLAEFHWY